MTEVLGINPLSPQWQARGDTRARTALDALLRRLLTDRQAARQARDFAVADRIRSELAEAGITIEDTPTGAHWSIDGE
jgi:cysteinyl-tRNA synthetase